MGNMVSEFGEDFKSAADYAGYGAPDFPDVHRAWVRRDWVSGSQGLINAGNLRMGIPRLYDYGGVGHCMLLPNVAGEVCEPAYSQMSPTGVLMGAEDQSQSQTSEPTQVPDQAETEHQEPAAQTPAPAPTASPVVQVWGAVMGVALIGIVAAILM